MLSKIVGLREREGGRSSGRIENIPNEDLHDIYSSQNMPIIRRISKKRLG